MSAIKEHYHDRIEAAHRTTARPILFSADMVRAILEGRKNQTRRIVKQNTADWFRTLSSIAAASAPQNKLCPYGYPGDHLWVRETYLQWQSRDGEKGEIAYYDDPQIEALLRDKEMLKNDPTCGNWRVIPSIHMPRVVSRLTLQITDIRAERLHDITETDAIDEGVLTLPDQFIEENFPEFIAKYKTWKKTEQGRPPLGPGPSDRYSKLWEKINGPGSWELNPWVWVIQFTPLARPGSVPP